MPLPSALQWTGKLNFHSGRLITILHSLVLRGELTPIMAGDVYPGIRLTVSEDKPMDGIGRSKEISVFSEANFKAPSEGDKFILF